MSYNPGDDFASLVSRANPAAQQNPYGQPGRNTYAPQAGSSQPTLAPSVDDRYKLDPFFDDEDEQQTPHATATTFPPSVSAPTPRHPGRQPSLTILDEPLDSSADLPLTKAAAPPAGRSFNNAGSSEMQQQNTWTFDDDEGLPAPNSRYERGGQPRNAPLRQQTKRTWKWPWERQKALAPERKIWLNDHPSNEAEGYCSNYVSTTKYNLVTFVPKFLLGTFRVQLRSYYPDVLTLSLSRLTEQFSKYANVFFLFTGEQGLRAATRSQDLLTPRHSLHSADPGCITNKSVHYNRASGLGLACIRLQGDPRRPSKHDPSFNDGPLSHGV